MEAGAMESPSRREALLPPLLTSPRQRDHPPTNWNTRVKLNCLQPPGRYGGGAGGRPSYRQRKRHPLHTRVHFCLFNTFLLIKHIFLPKRNLPHPTFLKTHDLLWLSVFHLIETKVRRNIPSSSELYIKKKKKKNQQGKRHDKWQLTFGVDFRDTRDEWGVWQSKDCKPYLKGAAAIQLQASPAYRNVNLVWIDFLIKKPEIWIFV